jgi:hypothetical protein
MLGTLISTSFTNSSCSLLYNMLLVSRLHIDGDMFSGKFVTIKIYFNYSSLGNIITIFNILVINVKESDVLMKRMTLMFNPPIFHYSFSYDHDVDDGRNSQLCN